MVWILVKWIYRLSMSVSILTRNYKIPLKLNKSSLENFNGHLKFEFFMFNPFCARKFLCLHLRTSASKWKSQSKLTFKIDITQKSDSIRIINSFKHIIKNSRTPNSYKFPLKSVISSTQFFSITSSNITSKSLSTLCNIQFTQFPLKIFPHSM